jgi:hypothetical protein
MSEVVDEPRASVDPAPRVNFLDSLALKIESRSRLFLGLSIGVILLITLAHAKRRFWFDELHTFYISQLPTFADTWQAVLSGLDFNPPAIYLLTRLSHRFLGISPTATRLPEILLFLVMCFSLYVFIRRRCGTLFALGGMWFPLITVASAYAPEARPHALVLGFCGLAMVSWQRATEGGKRGWALAIMSLSIAGFLMSHCYSLTILSAFGIAELVRLRVRRRPDWILWACVAAPMTSCLIYLPMLRHVKGFTMQSIAFQASLTYVPRFYAFLFNDPLGVAGRSLWHETLWPLLLVVILAGLSKGRTVATQSRADEMTGIPIHELVFLGTLSLLPLVGQALALAAKSPYNDRYGLAAICGLSPLLAFFIYRASGASRRAGLAMVLVFGSWFITDFGTWFYGLSQTNVWDLPTFELSSLPKDTLIVISDPLMFIEAEYYEPPQVVSRMRLLTDPALAIQYTGTDMFDRGSYKSSLLFPFKGQVEDYKTFLAANKHFMAYGPFTDPEDWLFRSLITSGAVVNIKGQSNYPSTHGMHCMLLDITTPGL